jgi:hypothetical protein
MQNEPSRAKLVIEAFGGSTKMGRTLGIPTTTVDSWGRNDSIPHWRRGQIIDAAHRESVKLPVAFLQAAADAGEKRGAA